MMNKELTKSDLSFILESLNYTKLHFEEYDKYPNNEFKQKRINDANEVIAKVKSLIQSSREF